MKNLLHNIQKLMMLATMSAGIMSCSDNWQETGYAEVSFSATIPADASARSFGEAEQVNTLIVGIFDQEQREIYRDSFQINGTSAEIQLKLAQEQTYNFVFWAYNNSQNIYNVTDLTAIKMNVIPPSITFEQAEAADAFFAVTGDITIMGDRNYSVKLIRPLAQINVGTTGKTMQTAFMVKSAPNTFHPFTNTVSGESNYTWSFIETTTETFSVEENTYNYLAMCYQFAPTISTTIPAELILTDGESSMTVEFSQVEIEANNRSNIVGRLTTE